MKKSTLKWLKLAVLTLATLGIGFAAIAFPFKLFDSLTASQMRYLFLGEMTLYFVLGMGFLFIKGKKEERKAREAARRFQKRIKFEQAQREYYDFAA